MVKWLGKVAQKARGPGFNPSSNQKWFSPLGSKVWGIQLSAHQLKGNLSCAAKGYISRGKSQFQYVKTFTRKWSLLQLLSRALKSNATEKNKFAQDKFVSRGFLSIGGKNWLPALSPKFLRAKLSKIIAIKMKKTFLTGLFCCCSRGCFLGTAVSSTAALLWQDSLTIVRDS